jgi:hypothetical protein
LGHILIELLLDACLAEEAPHRLDDYYAALAALDPQRTERAISHLATGSAERVAWLLPRFCAERFLYDYLDDARLLTRLNQVLKRAGLATVPVAIADLIPAMRSRIRNRQTELLTPSAR